MKEDLVTSYDKSADILYISFYNPPFEATDNHSVGNVILRYRWGELIGITLINASDLFGTSAETVKEEVKE